MFFNVESLIVCVACADCIDCMALVTSGVCTFFSSLLFGSSVSTIPQVINPMLFNLLGCHGTRNILPKVFPFNAMERKSFSVDKPFVRRKPFQLGNVYAVTLRSCSSNRVQVTFEPSA